MADYYVLRLFVLAPRSGERIKVRGSAARAKAPHPPACGRRPLPARAGRGADVPIPTVHFYNGDVLAVPEWRPTDPCLPIGQPLRGQRLDVDHDAAALVASFD